MSEREMQMLTTGIATKADKMRILERNGVSRADIARFLKVRYQQVRNTLEGDKRTGYNPTLDSHQTPLPSRSGEDYVTLAQEEDGSVRIPGALIDDAVPGNARSPILAIRIGHGLFVTSLDGAVARLREAL